MRKITSEIRERIRDGYRRAVEDEDEEMQVTFEAFQVSDLSA